jgi:hypothetical protein
LKTSLTASTRQEAALKTAGPSVRGEEQPHDPAGALLYHHRITTAVERETLRIQQA